MTRAELVIQISSCRKASGKSVKEICHAMTALPNDLYRIEKGAHNFNLMSAFNLLTAIGYEFCLTKGRNKVQFSDYAGLLNWYQELKGDRSRKEMVEDTGLSPRAISNIESSVPSISVDSFLQLVNTSKWKIKIQPSANPPTEKLDINLVIEEKSSTTPLCSLLSGDEVQAIWNKAAQLRIKSGKSVLEISQQLHKTQNDIKKAEAGKSNWTITQFYKYLSEFGYNLEVRVDEFAFDSIDKLYEAYQNLEASIRKRVAECVNLSYRMYGTMLKNGNLPLAFIIPFIKEMKATIKFKKL